MHNPNEWNQIEYEETFYFYAEEAGLDLTEENRKELKPLIAKACDKGIPTHDLVEIVKGAIT